MAQTSSSLNHVLLWFRKSLLTFFELFDNKVSLVLLISVHLTSRRVHN